MSDAAAPPPDPTAPAAGETDDLALLPAPFLGWFRSQGWETHSHQLAMLRAAAEGRSALLIAPTGGGKTLAGFLPSMVELWRQGAAPRDAGTALHTLYISPLKALAVDIQRNLDRPLAELRLPIAAETRTGDTPANRRDRQRRAPPHMLLTTPESLAVLLTGPDAARQFRYLRTVIVDELHALVGTKRGDLLALGLARLATLAPGARRVGLSATVAYPDALVAWLSREGRSDDPQVAVVRGAPGPKPLVEVLDIPQDIPWAGHTPTFAMKELYRRIQQHRVTLVFVNTRSQAELLFQALWRHNDDNLPIAVHHGSLSQEQRRKVEGAMAEGRLRAVVATSSLDLGIDWAAVDLVVQIGAPKGISRLIQRIGRSNHRFDSPSQALLVPSNRFEVLECHAAVEALHAGDLDGTPPRPGNWDVLAQHMLCRAVAEPFDDAQMLAEIRAAAPYAEVTEAEYLAVRDFVATGGYALRSYERYRRIVQDEDGRWRVANRAVARDARMNIGTIIDTSMVKVRIGRGAIVGEIDEGFINQLVPGDTFVFAGQLLRFTGLSENTAQTEKTSQGDPRVPVWDGGRFSLSTHLAERVRVWLADPGQWAQLPAQVQEWLALQQRRSRLPRPDELLVEVFPRQGRFFLVAYGFEGRNAHQTLGMLLTRRMERFGYGPLGFVASDYSIAIWSLFEPGRLDELFAQDLMGDDLEEWMTESSMLRRTFRNCALISGLILRRMPGEERKPRQVTFNADLIYDVLRRHQPGHILLDATRRDAAGGMVDIRRIGDMLARVAGRLTAVRLDRPSPLAIPVMLEIGREQVRGEAAGHALRELEAELLAEAVPELLLPPRDADTESLETRKTAD